MLRKILFFILVTLSLSAYDFGEIPKINVVDIPKGEPLMIQFGKTKCIWCEHMAPFLKDIKNQYPKTPIYYVNTDKDPLGAINHNVTVLPTSIFWDREGKETGRIVGYLTPNKILDALRKYGVLVEENSK